MKNRSKNKLNYIAAGIFLMGLIANVSLSITDPFIFVDTDVIARTSGSSGSGSSSSSSGGGSGWFWQARTEPCTYSITITVGGGPIPGAWQRTDTYNGTRRVCDDGWSLCLSNMCS